MNLEITVSVKANGNIVHTETLQQDLNVSKGNKKYVTDYIETFFSVIDNAKKAQEKVKRVELIANAIDDNVQHNADDVPKSNQPT